MKKIILFLLAVSVCSTITQANDTAGTLLPTGEIRLEKQPGIVLRHEALLLSNVVTVDYLFENKTDTPITTKVFFPIPTLGPIISYWEYPHDFEFRVWSDGQEIIPSLSRKITLRGTDVTKYFDLMGIDSYVKAITLDVFDAGVNGPNLEKIAEPLRKLPLAEQKKLEQLGMIAKGCFEEEEEIIDPCKQAFEDYHWAGMMEGTDLELQWQKVGTEYVDLKSPVSLRKQVLNHYPQCKDRILAKDELKVRKTCTHNPDIYHLNPGWTDGPGGPNPYHQEVMYYWTQTFPPHQTVHIRHEYNPSFYSNSIGAPNFFNSDIIGWKYEKPHDFWMGAAYIITTANNWQTPIGKFNLLIWGGVGAAVAAPQKDHLYEADQASLRIAPRNYLLETRKDFVPSNEILFDLALKFNEKDNSLSPISTHPQLYRVDGPAHVRTKPNGKKIATLENGRYVWAYPAETKDWFVVLLDEKMDGYTYHTNLIPFGK